MPCTRACCPLAGVLGIEASYGAATPSKSGSRRSMHRQGSTNSTASRFSACSSYVSAGRSSTGGGRRLGHEASHISSGGSSGHTLRSRASCSVSGSLHRKHQAKRCVCVGSGFANRAHAVAQHSRCRLPASGHTNAHPLPTPGGHQSPRRAASRERLPSLPPVTTG
jgi:hypothetical protein